MEALHEMCSHCLSTEHKIDVRGHKYLDEGDAAPYLICHSCCTQLRHYHFNDEHEKSRAFWHQVWDNLTLAVCVE